MATALVPSGLKFELSETNENPTEANRTEGFTEVAIRVESRFLRLPILR